MNTETNRTQSIRGFTIHEGDFFVGRYTLDTAPNDFLRELMRKASEYGEARALDEEGCEVTVTADD